ncbi:MAG: DUF1801 domain-containing protein [Candidatus Dormibacteria bacterium]
MGRSEADTSPVEAYIRVLPPARREVAEALRAIVRAAAPQCTESIKWAQPVFDDHGPFAYLKSHSGHITFGFWRGVELDARRGLLESGGSKMAHVKLRSLADVDKELLTALIKKAVKLNREQGDPTRTH